MLMMVMGVATWMFPRPARDDARYRPALADSVYWILTLAAVLRAVGEVVAGPHAGGPGQADRLSLRGPPGTGRSS